LIMVSALGSFSYGCTSVFLNIYLYDLGFTPTLIGILAMLSMISSSILGIISGILADKYGKRLMVVVGCALCTFSFLIFAVTTDIMLISAASLIGGIGSGIYYTSWSALIADKSPGDILDRVYSFSAFISGILTSIGTLLGALPDILYYSFGFGRVESYKPLFVMTVFLFASATLLGASVSEGKLKERREKLLPQKSMDVISKFVVVNVLIGFGAGFIIPLFNLWYKLKFDVGLGLISVVFFVSNITLSVSYLCAPLLARKIGLVNSIVLTQGTATMLLATIPLLPDPTIVAIVYIVRTLLMNMSNPLLSALLMNLTEPEERGSASGIVGSAWNIPNAISPSLGGFLMEHVSLALPFYICALNYTAAILLFYAFFKKYESDTDGIR